MYEWECKWKHKVNIVQGISEIHYKLNKFLIPIDLFRLKPFLRNRKLIILIFFKYVLVAYNNILNDIMLHCS